MEMVNQWFGVMIRSVVTLACLGTFIFSPEIQKATLNADSSVHIEGREAETALPALSSVSPFGDDSRPLVFFSDLGITPVFWEKEQFLFKISWWKIHTGYADIQSSGIRHESGSDSLRFTAKAWTTAFFSKFFAVDDTLESCFEPIHNRPSRYRETIREGSYKRDRDIIFDHVGRKASQNGRNFSLSRWTQDPFSTLQVLRTIRMGTDEILAIDVFANRQRYEIECDVGTLEWLTTDYGSFLCYSVTLRLKQRGRVLEKNSQLRLWFTADDNRWPVRLETSVKIGTITADLIAVNPTKVDRERLTGEKKEESPTQQ